MPCSLSCRILIPSIIRLYSHSRAERRFLLCREHIRHQGVIQVPYMAPAMGAGFPDGSLRRLGDERCATFRAYDPEPGHWFHLCVYACRQHIRQESMQHLYQYNNIIFQLVNCSFCRKREGAVLRYVIDYTLKCLRSFTALYMYHGAPSCPIPIGPLVFCSC